MYMCVNDVPIPSSGIITEIKQLITNNKSNETDNNL